MDQELLRRCLEEKPRGWEDFVDRFISLVFHVIDVTAKSRETFLSESQRNEVAGDVFRMFHENKFQLLRGMDARNHVTTYLTILTRRIVLRLLANGEFCHCPGQSSGHPVQGPAQDVAEQVLI